MLRLGKATFIVLEMNFGKNNYDNVFLLSERKRRTFNWKLFGSTCIGCDIYSLSLLSSLAALLPTLLFELLFLIWRLTFRSYARFNVYCCCDLLQFLFSSTFSSDVFKTPSNLHYFYLFILLLF